MRRVEAAMNGIEASAYGAQMETGEMRLVLINKDSSKTLEMSIPARQGTRVWRLEAPSLSATSNVMLAGCEIRADQQWKPRNEERIPSSKGYAAVSISPASAAAVFID